MSSATEQATATNAAMGKEWVYEQVLGKLPHPEKKFTGQTIIVTGANSGLGLEAARHFARLEAAKVIIAVRSLPKGEEAKQSILESEKLSSSTIEVWELDLASYASTKKFAERANRELERLDVVVANAGIYMYDFNLAEQDESTITVNVVSTILMGIMLLPKLRDTSVKYSKETVLNFTGSFVHYLTTFPERDAENIFEGLANKETARMDDRYNVSKTMELFLVRELATQMTASKKEGNVVTSILNPGFVVTSIMRHNQGRVFNLLMIPFRAIAGRSPEVGGRTLVWAAYGGPETHGKYLDHCKVGKVAPYITDEKGQVTQKKLWAELSAKLEKIQPGVMSLV